MEDFNIDVNVEMGRLTNPPHTDNTIRVYVSQNKVNVQFRKDTWYLHSELDRVETVKLIHVLTSALLKIVEN